MQNVFSTEREKENSRLRKVLGSRAGVKRKRSKSGKSCSLARSLARSPPLSVSVCICSERPLTPLAHTHTHTHSTKHNAGTATPRVQRGGDKSNIATASAHTISRCMLDGCVLRASPTTPRGWRRGEISFVSSGNLRGLRQAPPRGADRALLYPRTGDALGSPLWNSN